LPALVIFVFAAVFKKAAKTFAPEAVSGGAHMQRAILFNGGTRRT
jgi:hypothetical protein